MFVEEVDLNFEVTPEELLFPVSWHFQLLSFFRLCLFISWNFFLAEDEWDTGGGGINVGGATFSSL